MKIRDFYLEQVKKSEELGKETYPAFLYLLHILKMNETEIYLNFDEEMKEDKIQEFNLGYKKYLENNEPIQYIIGKHNFFGYDFIVNNDVLIPRFETEELVANILELYDQYFEGQDVKAVDVGTGSGAIAISLKLEEPHFEIIGTDISEGALRVAEQNAKNLDADVKFLQGDMLEPLKGMKFDFLISNPPYIPSEEEVQSLVKDNEPNVALFGGEDGLKFYRIILAGAKELLNERAIIAFEHGYNKSLEIEKIALNYFPSAKVIHKKDMQKKNRMTFILVGDFQC